MECVLDRYLYAVQDEVKEGMGILIHEAQGWNDSMSMIIVRLEYIQDMDGDLFNSEYESTPVYIFKYELSDAAGYNEGNAFPNNLNWMPVKLSADTSDPLSHTGLSSLGLHFTYSTKNRCIEKLVQFPTKTRNPLKIDCSLCHFGGRLSNGD